MIILEYNASLFCVSREGPTLQQMPRVGGGGAELPPIALPLGLSQAPKCQVTYGTELVQF